MMNPVIRKILEEGGMNAEEIAVLSGLARTVTSETRDAVQSAADCMPAHLREAVVVFLSRTVEACMHGDIEKWKTDDAPEA